MKPIKIFIVEQKKGQFYDYPNWIKDSIVVDTLEEADLVLFAGGEDVSPILYNEPRGRCTNSNWERDYFECEVFAEAKRLNKHILGICRGSQFICVMAGGSLVQDQNNPRYYHEIKVEGEKDILITSTHHQAQYPFVLPNEEYKIIGYTNNISPFHVNGYGEELNPNKECEIVYYPKIKALGIQGHPEKMFIDYKHFEDFTPFEKEVKRTHQFCNKLVRNLLNDKL